MTDKIILASQSPRRRELLAILGFKNFQIVPANIEENIPPQLPIGEAVSEVAFQKAAAVRSKAGDSGLILAADTVVALDGKILGKPSDIADARNMLRSLSGRTHEVYTGVAIINKNIELKRYETTHVTFRDISDMEIDAYIAADCPLDKAGAYAAQSLASLFIKKIDGDFFNVVGLPLYLLGQMLDEAGIKILNN